MRPPSTLHGRSGRSAFVARARRSRKIESSRTSSLFVAWPPSSAHSTRALLTSVPRSANLQHDTLAARAHVPSYPVGRPPSSHAPSTTFGSALTTEQQLALFTSLLSALPPTLNTRLEPLSSQVSFSPRYAVDGEGKMELCTVVWRKYGLGKKEISWGSPKVLDRRPDSFHLAFNSLLLADPDDLNDVALIALAHLQAFSSATLRPTGHVVKKKLHREYFERALKSFIEEHVQSQEDEARIWKHRLAYGVFESTAPSPPGTKCRLVERNSRVTIKCFVKNDGVYIPPSSPRDISPAAKAAKEAGLRAGTNADVWSDRVQTKAGEEEEFEDKMPIAERLKDVRSREPPREPPTKPVKKPRKTRTKARSPGPEDHQALPSPSVESPPSSKLVSAEIASFVPKWTSSISHSPTPSGAAPRKDARPTPKPSLSWSMPAIASERTENFSRAIPPSHPSPAPSSRTKVVQPIQAAFSLQPPAQPTAAPKEIRSRIVAKMMETTSEHFASPAPRSTTPDFHYQPPHIQRDSRRRPNFYWKRPQRIPPPQPPAVQAWAIWSAKREQEYPRVVDLNDVSLNELISRRFASFPRSDSSARSLAATPQQPPSQPPSSDMGTLADASINAPSSPDSASPPLRKSFSWLNPLTWF